MTKPKLGRRGAAVWLALGVLLLAGWWLAAPGRLGGSNTYVTTHGISMAPRFHNGDLAVVRRADSYRVGDVVAYRSGLFRAVVMHRLVAVEHGYYTFKGDNNSWLDPEKTTRDHLIGKLVLRVPQGGVWLKRFTDPTALALIALGLLAGGGTAARARRNTRRKRRGATVFQHASPSGLSRAVSTLPPPLRTAAAVAASVGILGLAVAALAWTRLLDTPATTQTHAIGQVSFSYTAEVGRTPAYDTTIARSPDPVFRKLTDTVDVHFTYRGNPGSVSVTARLSTPGGWHSNVPLAAPTRFTGNRYQGTVRLDLTAFDARAKAAAAITGLPAGPVSIALTPSVKTGEGPAFRPTLEMSLSPLQLALVGDAKDLTVADATTTAHSIRAPRTLGLLGWRLSVDMARTVSVILLLAALLAAGVVGLLARRTLRADEAVDIRRRYDSLLVRVRPIPRPSGRPVIDVTAFATLAKLAERYGLLILHWSHSDVETFIVQDEGSIYRYTAGVQTPDYPQRPRTPSGTTEAPSQTRSSSASTTHALRP